MTNPEGSLPRPDRPGGPARFPWWRVLIGALLATAAALAVTVALGHDGSTGAAAAPTSHPPAGSALPGDARALVGFVSGGTRVVAARYAQGAARAGQPMRPTPGAVEFTTPSGNIACGIVGPVASAGLVCEVARHSWTAPARPATCRLNWAGGALALTSGRVGHGLCLGGPAFAPVSLVLPYGSSIRQGSLACRSSAAFLACADVHAGHGFAVNRAAVRAY